MGIFYMNHFAIWCEFNPSLLQQFSHLWDTNAIHYRDRRVLICFELHIFMSTCIKPETHLAKC